MKTLPLLLVVSGLALVTAGCQYHRAYAGPRQPSKAVSQIKPDDHLRVLSIDGSAVAKEYQRKTWLLVLPGEHEVALASWDYDFRVLGGSNNVHYVGRVLLIPETTPTLKLVSTAGTKYRVQYQRTQDEATYSVLDVKTGQRVAWVNSRLKVVAVPAYAPYYYGPPYYGPPYYGPPYYGPPFYGPVIMGPPIGPAMGPGPGPRP